jgi:hypothetical protein
LPVSLRDKLFRQVVLRMVRCCRWSALEWAVPGVKPGGMFFINVNQVLVRLWARCGRKSDRMWSVPREFLVGDGSSRDRGNVFRDVCCVLSQDDPVQDRSWARRLVFGLGRPHKGLLITDH